MKTILLTIALLLQISLVTAQPNNILHTQSGKLHYQTFGNGAPLLLINGGPGMSSEGFIPLAKELAKNNLTIIYDQRGTGLSKLDKTDATTVTMDFMVQDIEILRNHLGIEEWILMGHSFGGILAYYYAVKHPDRVKAMIQSSSGGMDLSLLTSLNIVGGLSPMERDSLNFYNQKIQNGDTSYATRLKRGEFLAPAYLFNKANIPIVAERLTQGNGDINGLIWQNLRQIKYDTKKALKIFDKPVLIIHGKEDIVGMNIPKIANKVLPNSELVVLENTRHYGWLDNPDSYFKAINSFLTKL